MRTTTTMSAGLAFEPEKDLATFAAMAAQGKRLAGTAKLGHGWRFVDSEPEDVVFDLTYENDPDTDYLEYFRAAGWTHVLTVADVHIFKARHGTPPVHTGGGTRRAELVRERNRFAIWSLLALALFVAVGVAISRTDGNPWLEVALLIAALIPVVYTVMPLMGYWHRSRQLS